MGNRRGHVNGNHEQKKPKRLLDLTREVLRRKHYSIRTEEAYIGWIVRYIDFHNKRHPKDMGVPEIEAFLTHLAVEENVSGSTQNQAFNALLFPRYYNRRFFLQIRRGRAIIPSFQYSSIPIVSEAN